MKELHPFPMFQTIINNHKYIIRLYLSQLNFRGHELFECSMLLGKCSQMPLIGETCVFFNSPPDELCVLFGIYIYIYAMITHLWCILKTWNRPRLSILNVWMMLLNSGSFWSKSSDWMWHDATSSCTKFYSWKPNQERWNDILYCQPQVSTCFLEKDSICSDRADCVSPDFTVLAHEKWWNWKTYCKPFF